MLNKIFTFYFFCNTVLGQELFKPKFELEADLQHLLIQAQQDQSIVQKTLNDGETVLNTFINFDAPLEAIKYVIELGAPINLKDIYGYSPLHFATERNRIDVVEYLLSLGADPNIKANFRDLTPLHIAAEAASPELIGILLANAVECDVLDSNDNSPLHIAIANNKIDNTQTLLQACVEVNFANNNRQTPLHLAVEVDQIGMVNDLLQAGADPNARDFLNKSPLDYVQLDSENGPSIAAALKSAGAIEQQPDINRDEIWSEQFLGIDSQENINILEDDLGLLVSEQASLYKLNPIILEDYIKQLFKRKKIQELPVTRQDVINWIYAFAAANYSE